MAKAKLYLDTVMLDLKIVPEYPDMVEENGILYQKLEVMDEEIRSYHERIE